MNTNKQTMKEIAQQWLKNYQFVDTLTLEQFNKLQKTMYIKESKIADVLKSAQESGHKNQELLDFIRRELGVWEQ